MKCSYFKCIYGKYVVPIRYVIGIYAFCVIVFYYTRKSTLNFLVLNMSKDYSYVEERICPLRNKSSFPIFKVKWSYDETNDMIFAQYYGYLIGNLPGGILADKFGARHVLSISFLISYLLTFLAPLIFNYDNNIFSIFMFFTGVFQGPSYPAVSSIISRWIPKNELSTLGALAYSGVGMGQCLGILISSLLIKKGISRNALLFFWGGISTFFHILYLLHTYSDASTHPNISDEEKVYIEKFINQKRFYHFPWKKVFSDSSVYGLIFGQFAHDWIFFTLLTQLPTYLKEVLHYNIKEDYEYTSMAFGFMSISSLFTGILSDSAIKKKWCTSLKMRKTNTTVGLLIPSVCLLIVGYVGCDGTQAYIIFCFSLFFKGCFYPGLKVNLNEMTLNFGGTLMGIANGVGATTAILVPFIQGRIASDNSLRNWRLIFWLTLFVVMFSNVIYISYAVESRRPWDLTDDEKSEENRFNLLDYGSTSGLNSSSVSK